MVVLSVVAAAGWGLGPVIIELAENANGGASAGMMVGSQALGAVLLGGHHAGPAQPRHGAPPGRSSGGASSCLLVTAGALEAVFAVLYYLIIEAIGAVLTLLITATSPVFAIIGGAIFLKEPVGKRLAIAAAVTIGGVVIATLARDGLRARGGRPAAAARRAPAFDGSQPSPELGGRRRDGGAHALFAAVGQRRDLVRGEDLVDDLRRRARPRGRRSRARCRTSRATNAVGQLVLALAQEDPRLLGAEEVAAGTDPRRHVEHDVAVVEVDARATRRHWRTTSASSTILGRKRKPAESSIPMPTSSSGRATMLIIAIDPPS